MFGYVETPKTYRAAREMAKVAGVDLTSAVFDGWLRRDELKLLLQRCDGCGRSPGCTSQSEISPVPVPDYCRVKPDLEALSAA